MEVSCVGAGYRRCRYATRLGLLAAQVETCRDTSLPAHTNTAFCRPLCAKDGRLPVCFGTYAAGMAMADVARIIIRARGEQGTCRARELLCNSTAASADVKMKEV